MKLNRMRAPAILGLGTLVLAALACFNSGPHTTTLAASRFEVATSSVVLGGQQLLVDTSNGDVWVLEGARSPDAHWVLLVRGPEDARKLTEEDMPPPAMRPDNS